MAELAPQVVDHDGLSVAFSAAAAGGDSCKVTDEKNTLVVKNDSAGSVNVTLITPGDVKGLAIADRVVAVAAGAVALVPLTLDYQDPATKLADWTYSASASVSAAVIRL